MNYFLFFFAVITTTYGWVEWKDARLGSSALPRTEDEAKTANWKKVSIHPGNKISWYRHLSSGFQVAFDNKQRLAGVRIAQKDADLLEDYEGINKKSGVFEQKTLQSSKFWVSDVLFVSPDVLRGGGRDMSDEDPVALGLYVKRAGQWTKLERGGCDYVNTGGEEQGCQPGYGLILSDLKQASTCDSLSPFYIVIDPKAKGDTVAFGWLYVGKALPHSKAVNETSLKVLFPYAPACLRTAASQGILRDITIYLTYSSSAKTTCTSSTGEWYEDSCQRKFRDLSQWL